MDEELEEFLSTPTFVAEETEIDFDYEFDAPQFYDFTRLESLFKAVEAERWFQSAESCPPSPFVVKLNGIYQISEEAVSNSKDDEGIVSARDDSIVNMESEASARNRNKIGVGFCKDQDVTHSKSRTSPKSSPSRSSTLMKPTASYLAKQNQLHEAQFHQYLRRHQRSVIKSDNSSQNSSVIENQATKRQKLEAGYLSKVSHLKHQALYLHKVAKVGFVDFNSVHARPKVTIPKEPMLETAQRAQRHRAKVNAELSEDAKSNPSTFKARPLNKKILECPSVPLSKKGTIHHTEFQVFHLRTSERARHHTSNNVTTMHNCNSTSQDERKDSRRLNSYNAVNKDRCEATEKSKHHPLHKKEYNCPTRKISVNEPPTAQFSKLSLASENKSQTKMPPSPKGLKENSPRQNEKIKAVKETSPRFGGNRLPCGVDRRFNEVGGRFPISRNLDIR